MRRNIALIVVGLSFVLAAGVAQAAKKSLSEKELKEIYKQAVELGNQNKLDEAMAKFTEVIRAEPRYWPAHLKLGLALESSYRWPEALACYVNAIEALKKLKGKPQAEPHIYLGKLYRKMGMLDMAVEAHKQATEIDPKNAKAYIELGQDFTEKKIYADAIPAFQKASELDPKDTKSRVMLAHTYLVMNRDVDAEGIYQAILKDSPEDAEANFGMGKLLKKRNKHVEAQDFFKKACQKGLGKACTAAKGNVRAM